MAREGFVSAKDRAIAPPPSVFEPACRGLALIVPLVVSALSACAIPDWRSDQKVVETLGFVPFAADGVLSTVLAQVSSLVPLGGRLARAGFASALAAGVAGWFLYSLVRSWLHSARPSPRLAPPIALAATVTALLGPGWQGESTHVGGASAAAAAVMAGLYVDQRLFGARRWMALGMVLGLCASENRFAALCLLVALAVRVTLTLKLPARRELCIFAASALGVMTVCLAPVLLRAGSGRTWIEFGVGWSSLAWPAAGLISLRPTFPEVWTAEAGIVGPVLAACGLVWGLVSARTRPFAAVCVAMLGMDAIFGQAQSLLFADPAAPVRLLAIFSLACGTALAVHSAALTLLEAPVVFAQPAAVLLVVFDFTLALSTMDRAVIGSKDVQSAAETWTDEALSELPQDSLVLARSPWIAWRLWAARVVRGHRPDILVVPLPMIGRNGFATSLLEAEPALVGLVREVAISGRPSEYSLSTLADTRPLYVELDRTWDRRLIDHLRPNPLWLGFAAHALGRSDRTEALLGGRTAFRRVLAAARDDGPHDEATLAVLSAAVREQAVALATLGDHTNLERVLSDLRAIDPAQEFLSELTRRLATRQRGRVDVRELLE